MSYSVKEMFYSLQGEGVRAGRPAVFIRFAGCNLWSGREQDRASAQCTFCDTDFVGVGGAGGGKFESAADLARAAAAFWPGGGAPYVVCTGGEPLLQLDAPLIDALHAEGFEIAIETNGTLAVPRGVDWVCVSPKGQTHIVVRKGDELKLVYPQTDVDPARFADWAFDVFLLQPMDVAGDEAASAANTKAALAYCLEHPSWRLSLQTHKALSIR